MNNKDIPFKSEEDAEDDLNKLIIVGDRLLIKPSTISDTTRSGLYLPPGVAEKEKVHSGYIIKVGPGYPLPSPIEDEPWKDPDETIKYLPLQAKEGDLAIYLQSAAIEVMYKNEKYVIIPQRSILMLERDEGLFE